jgi:Lon protease-like protein
MSRPARMLAPAWLAARTPFANDRMDSIATTPPPLPDTLPVMVLSDCFLFPGCQLPLFIFEERYRRMLSHALATDRMFCIGTRQGREAARSEIFPVSAAGLVRVCKTQPDGTSHVLLVGLQRIRLLGWEQQEPFLQARVEPLPSRVESKAELETLRCRALDLLPCGEDEASREHLSEIRRQLETVESAEIVCDFLAHRFVRRSACSLRLLAEPCVEVRYRLLIEELERQRTSA